MLLALAWCEELQGVPEDARHGRIVLWSLWKLGGAILWRKAGAHASYCTRRYLPTTGSRNCLKPLEPNTWRRGIVG
ncbi:unnamed protein product [Ectocarpus sp. CCAP 1310/34]|nr:unnamed protein product [Ectocarpus sp. CCAP 1310/34]